MPYSAFEKASEFTYKLYFHENIEEPGKDIPGLTIVQRTKTTLTRKGKSFDIDLDKLSFDRNIYQPGCITANIQISFQSDNVTDSSTFFSQDDLKELLLQRRVTLTVEPVSDPKAVTTIAENYYVHEIVPQMIRDSQKNMLFVKLNIFSMDKLMTLNQYSKAYVTKRLGADILSNESKIFGFKTQLVKVNTENMQSLVYQNTAQAGATCEFIQPYLVQYNESFYDFMVRVANRCGEFLMFENGQLILGLPKNAKANPIKNYASVSYQNMSAAPLSIKAFTRDSVKGEKRGEFNDSPVDKDKTGYPVGTFGTDYTYNAELTHDDYIFPMFKDSFSSFGRALGMYNTKSAVRKLSLDLFSNIVSNCDDAKEGAKGIAKNMLIGYGAGSFNAHFAADSANSNGNSAWIDSYKNKPQQTDGTMSVPFSTASKEGWVKLAYYSQIRKDEEEQQKKIMHIDMGANIIPVKLGDLVKIDKISGKFIVIRVEQQSDISKKTGTTPGSTVSKITQSQLIDVIPVIEAGENGKDRALPPVIEQPVIRKSGPQTAFIVANGDPKNQGRVRIAFPWQAVGDPVLKQDLQQAKDDLEQKSDVTKKAKAKQEQLQKALELMQAQNKGLSKLQAELEQESDVKKQKELIQKKQEENKAKLDANTKRVNEIHDNLTNEGNPESLVSKLKAAAQNPEAKDQEEKLQKEKVKQEEEYKKLNEENKLLKGIDDDLKGYSSNSPTTPAEFLKKKQETRSSGSIATTKSSIKEADKEIETAQKAQDEAQAVVTKLTRKWEDLLIEVASPWVRVAMPMATEEGGMYFTPRPGDEVMVNFDCDNVERPYVTGSLYSKEHVRPNENMVIKSPSGQKILFDVAEDDGQFVQTLTPMLSQVGKLIPGFGKKLTFGKDARKLCGGINITDEFGMFSVSMSSNNRSVDISSPFGTVGINAFTGISISAPNGDINIKGKNVSIEAGNNLRLISGTNVTNENSAPEPDPVDHGGNEDEFKHAEKTSQKLKRWGKTGAKAVGSSIADGAKALVVDGGISLIESKAQEYTGKFQVVDMYLLRCLADVFLRPIEGTLLVKSRNYLMLEAGKGRAEVPIESYSKAWQDLLVVEKDPEKQKFYAKTSAFVNRINEKIGNFCNDYDKLYQEAVKSEQSYNIYLNSIWKKDDNEKPKVKEDGFKNAKKEFKANDDHGAGGTISLEKFTFNHLKHQENGHKTIIGIKGEKLTTDKEVQLYMKPVVDHFGEACWALHKHVLSFKNCINDDTIKAINEATLGAAANEETKWIDNAFKKALFDTNKSLLETLVKNWQKTFGDLESGPKSLFIDPSCPEVLDIFRNTKYLKRWLVATFLLELHKSNENLIPPKVGIGPSKPGKIFTICYNKVDSDLVYDHWADVARLAPKKTGLLMKYMKKIANFAVDAVGVKGAYSNMFNSSKPKMGWDRRVWNGKGGKIIFSDAENTTFRIENEVIHEWKHADLGNEGMLKQAIINTK